MSKDNNHWFSKKKKEFPQNDNWTFPDIESAFRAMQRDIMEKQKELSKANQHVPIYFGSFNNKKTANCKRHFIQGYKVTTGPDGKTRITKFGDQSQKRNALNLQSFKKTARELEPLLDIIHLNKEVLVVMELPNKNKKDIIVKLGNKKIIISIKNSKSTLCKKIDLPMKIDKNQVKTTYKNGVLSIILPKA